VESIGRPIDNTQIYILDSQRQPVPIGVAGEIYIGGEGVARGYLHRPELTEERFLVDPVGLDPAARVYRTGDLGRWRADGCIEYLGRNDHQIKLRGFRIELGEIEAQLLQHPQVKEAVVLAHEGQQGDKRLVAYIVIAGGRDEPPGGGFRQQFLQELREYLQGRLPEYMIPAAWVVLGLLPLTPNGKLDRKALPAPEEGDAHLHRPFEAPQGEVEEILAEIWRSLLRVERVGRDDNFFELGGHSVLGMRMVERFTQRVGIRAPVAAVFRYPTIREMAGFAAGVLAQKKEPDNSRLFELESGTL